VSNEVIVSAATPLHLRQTESQACAPCLESNVINPGTSPGKARGVVGYQRGTEGDECHRIAERVGGRQRGCVCKGKESS
jgi:hypothetical protein